VTVPTSVLEVAAALRRDYLDAVRLCAREEILAELAEEPATAQLHAATAQHHHGSARAYARAVEMLMDFWGEEEKFDLHADLQRARAVTMAADLAPMRRQGRRYRGL
jgi:hypothetical protein